MRNSRIGIRPTSGALGAEVFGINLADEFDAAVVSDIWEAFNAHGVIFFRNQRLTPEQHIAFAERMGRININRFFKAAPGYPQIAEVRKEPVQTTNIGGGWHTDHSYDQIPALGSILLARELPPVEATQCSRAWGKHMMRFYVNAAFTTHFEGWTEKESKPLLDFLYQHAARPEFQTRFKWEEGSIAFSDNRATWHYALNDYQGERRLMHRITIEGVPLVAAD
jgi:alpha-ketoglutarate-dependent taurine dioxygenase